MNLHAKTRKGQSAIEYLSTYGWALLAILVVVGAIMQMGVLNPCSSQQPRFTGQDVTLNDWAFTGTNDLQLVVEPSANDVTLGRVTVDPENGAKSNWTGSQAINQGDTFTADVTLSGNPVSSGSCLRADVSMVYNTSSLTDAHAAGEGVLQGQAP